MPRVVIVSGSEARARFQRDRRLHSPSEFAAVLSARRTCRGESFDLHFLEVQTRQQARLGLIVPKRLARSAVVRNAIKRQGREAFRLGLGNMKACDVVLRLKRPVSCAKPEFRQQIRAWRGEIENLLDRLALRGT